MFGMNTSFIWMPTGLKSALLLLRNEKLSSDVDLAELAQLTKNFSGAEIEGLVRAAQSCALNRLVKASTKVGQD